MRRNIWRKAAAEVTMNPGILNLIRDSTTIQTIRRSCSHWSLFSCLTAGGSRVGPQFKRMIFQKSACLDVVRQNAHLTLNYDKNC